MSDQVRKEMRIFGDETRPYPAPPATRPQRSNLGSRLKIGRDLQVQLKPLGPYWSQKASYV